MLQRFATKWNNYKYRFVPWIAYRLKQRRTVRAVPLEDDCVQTTGESLGNLEDMLTAFNDNVANLTKLNKPINKRVFAESDGNLSSDDILQSFQDHQILQSFHHSNLDVLVNTCGFKVTIQPSCVEGSGLGVGLKGTVGPGTVVALYPGLVYEPGEPIFFQSVRNPFVFRCADSLLIDGNNQKLSKYLYKSCANRDKIGPLPDCDVSWLTPWPINPLAIGQYVNNGNESYPANVAYQEFFLPKNYPRHLLKYIPNAFYSSIASYGSSRELKIVALVSLRQICNEELFSNYLTLLY